MEYTVYSYGFKIPEDVWNPIYGLQEAIAVIIIVSMIIYVLFNTRYTKYLITILLLTLAVINYAVLAQLTSYETVKILPLTIIETKNNYSTLSIDFGQVSIIILALMWRRKIIEKLKTLKTKPIKTTQKLETEKEEAAVV